MKNRFPITLFAGALLCAGAAMAAHHEGGMGGHAADPTCEAAAIDKNGKPLAGAAKSSFMRKCHAGAVRPACEAKALSKDGKPLSGAAKSAFVRRCQEDAQQAK